MHEQLRIFFTALMFYTRIPCPVWVDHAPEYINKATRFFPLIGWIVGGIGAGIFYATSLLVPYTIALLLSMIATILATGAFHEDGFADVCDAFGGGWSKEQILRIMKDSRLGTYGTVGLILMLAMKYLLYTELIRYGFPVIMVMMISAHTVSRVVPVYIIFTQEYARDNDQETDGKIIAKPVAQHMSLVELLTATAWGIIPFSLLCVMLTDMYSLPSVLILAGCCLIALLLIFYRSTRYFTRWIGGYTGDCLGAVQQVSEVALYLVFLALARYM